MDLKIKFGKRFEIDRIKSSLEKKDWYKSHNIGILLPGGVKTPEEVEDYVNKNFIEKDYKKEEDKILILYREINEKFTRAIKSHLKKELPKKLNIRLTKYGTGGSYSLPDSVIINISSRRPLIYVLKHEILHLLFEREIISKNLSHEEKEEFIKKIENSLS